ncbi:serine/threonine protein phosphatase 1 [Silicimonas algicola]|uniref:Serine/threonine protein phosphatase 1 n=1 Tax=Silicimonas algicola TaxID=1826607 RepID=A0A316FX25_9RHOB|nr:serine/threonine protein phosphatase 1 [Silicimonas algicola]
MGTRQAFFLDRAVQKARPLVASNERIYAIGDIHGRLDLLLELLEKIAADGHEKTDGRRARIVFLGDYIDRGEDPKGVLDLLARMAEFHSENLIFLRGNHEEALDTFLAAPREGRDWLDFGAQQTLASFGVAPPRGRVGSFELFRIRSELGSALQPYRGFLAGLRNGFRSGDVVFSHAGLDPSRAWDQQPARALLWSHPGVLRDNPVPGLRVVHGHFDEAAPVCKPGRICVDTGAYYSNRLTAVRLDDEDAFLVAGSGLS